jgi:hypothetical protein
MSAGSTVALYPLIVTAPPGSDLTFSVRKVDDVTAARVFTDEAGTTLATLPDVVAAGTTATYYVKEAAYYVSTIVDGVEMAGGRGVRKLVQGNGPNYFLPSAPAIPQAEFTRRSITDFGAVGDGRQLRACATTNASTTLTCATGNFTSADVGKSICVQSAAASNNHLNTTIASVTNSTTVVLATAASVTRSDVMAWVGTDNTAAVRAAIAQQVAEGGLGPYHVPDGIYLCTGTPAASAANSAVSALFEWPPLYTSDNGTPPCYGFRSDTPTFGLLPSIALSSPATKMRAHQHGAIFVCTWGGTPATGDTFNVAFGVITPNANVSSICHMVFDGITVRVPAKSDFAADPNKVGGPQMSAVDIYGAGSCFIKDLMVDTGEDGPYVIQPTNTSVTGFQAPAVNNSNAMVYIQHIVVHGFYYGIGMGEHFSGENVNAQWCNTALAMNAGNHIIHIKRAQLWDSLKCFGVGAGIGSGPNGSTLIVDAYCAERPGAGFWYTGQVDVDDPNNVLTGEIRNYAIVTANVGPDIRDGLVMNGGRYLTVRSGGGRLASAGQSFPPGFLTDTFKGTNGAVLTWLRSGQAWAGSAGTLKQGGTGDASFVYVDSGTRAAAGTGSNDYRIILAQSNLVDKVVELDITPSATGSRCQSGLIFAAKDLSNYLALIIENDVAASKLLLKKEAAGVDSNLQNTNFGSAPIPAYAGDGVFQRLKVILVGDIAYCYYNDQLCYTQVLTAGEVSGQMGSYVGLWSYYAPAANEDGGTRFHRISVRPFAE